MSTSLQYDKNYIANNLKDGTVLIDNTFLVDLSKDKDETLMDIVVALKNADCELITTMSVVREFARGAKSLSKYHEFEKLIEIAGINVIDLPSSLIDKDEVKKFIIAYSQEANKPSLTDTDLATVAYLYPESNIRLLSANYKDLPTSIFIRENFIAYDMNGELRTHGFYVIAPNKILNKTINKYA